MNLKKNGLVFLLFVLVSLVVVYTGSAQTERAIWLKVSDDNLSTDSTTMWFGNHPDATYALQDTLAFSSLGTIREQFGPPFPPGFGCYWVSIPGRVNTWGNGLLTYDFRPFPTNAARKDTFRIKFQNTDNSAANFTFSWPSAAELALSCDSIKCLPNGLTMVNMFDVSSTVVEAAGDNGTSTLTIFKWGKVNAVRPNDPTTPDKFALYSSYPNPFNPSTTIRYDVKNAGLVDISIYNVLGQKVITLVSENHAPGSSYSVTWNGLNSLGNAVSSGIYYARMTARYENNQEFSASQKLLLVK
jgi:hypothetical protein